MPTSKSFITQRNRRMSGTAHGSRSSVCANHRLVGCRIHTAQLSINHWRERRDFHLSAFMVYSDFVCAGARDSPMGGIDKSRVLVRDFVLGSGKALGGFIGR